MISNARGKHSSPGVYMQEIDKTYATRSLGVTTLGVVGETLKGPAFQPIRINDWNEFQDYFGGTSIEKFKGTGYPKYELPYIAKSYLQESKQLDVCRVLGLSGYKAGKAWVIYTSGGTGTHSGNTIVGIVRSKASYSSSEDNSSNCNGNADFDKLTFDVNNIVLTSATTINSNNNNCSNSLSSNTIDRTCGKNNYGQFNLQITAGTKTHTATVSLNPGDKNYIINVLGMNPQEGEYPVFVEELYDLAHIAKCDEVDNTSALTLCITGVTGTTVDNYLEQFREAITPWFVSEIKGNDIKKLFRFHTISDGNAANSHIKISIANILPEEGYFDVLIRDYNDVDASPVVLERFTRCNMVPGSANYIGLQIGTFNGEYINKSKYVTVEVIENDVTETCVPCGFLGYPVRKIGSFKAPELQYNKAVYEDLKYNRQYFGMSDIKGVDLDILMYKGKENYNPSYLPNDGYTCGFHLDSYISASTTVDGVSGYSFEYPDVDALNMSKAPHISTESDMNGTIYEDKRLRKFTCYPYGGFDGWDIYRTERTNTDKFRGNKYKGILNVNTREDETYYGLSVDEISGTTIYGTGSTFYVNASSAETKNCTNKLLDAYEKKVCIKNLEGASGSTSGVTVTLPNNATLKLSYTTGSTTIYHEKLSAEHPFTSAFDASYLRLTGKFNNSDYYAYLAGYKQFNNPSETKINLLATPGIDYVNNLSLFNEVLDVVEEERQGDCLYIVTTPDAVNGIEIEAEDAVSNLETQDISTSYAATYYPWVKYYDEANKRYINLPVTKDVVRNFAHTDNVSHPWFASAGMSRGNVECAKACHFTKLEEEDMLYEGMINPVKSFGTDGVKIWGNKTMYQEDTPLNRINVRRLMIRLKDLIKTASQQLVFEQNDNTVDAQFRSIVEPILANAKQNRGISDYRIKTDTSAEARDRKELPAAIYVKPINCLEYVDISFTIYPEGTKFEE